MRDGLLIPLVFVVGLVIGRWWPESAPPDDPIATESPVVETAPPALVATPLTALATATPDATAPPRQPGSPPPPLPPVGTPLATALPALRTRAEAGDVQAAIRWYHEARVCQMVGPVPARPPNQPPPDLRSAADRCLRQHLCASLPDEPQTLAALRWTAVNGNDDAAVTYARLPLIYWMNDPAIQGIAPRWPVEVRELLARARERGHAAAWLVTAEALTVGLGNPDLRRALPADPRGGLVILWALQQVPQPGAVLEQVYAGRGWAGLATQLGVSKSEQAALQSEGERLYRRYLASLTHLSAEIAASLRLIEPYAGGIRAGLAAVSPRCHTELDADPVRRSLPEPNPPTD